MVILWQLLFYIDKDYIWLCGLALLLCIFLEILYMCFQVRQKKLIWTSRPCFFVITDLINFILALFFIMLLVILILKHLVELRLLHYSLSVFCAQSSIYRK